MSCPLDFFRRMGVKFSEKGREWRVPDLMYADDLVLCSELKEELKVMVGQCNEVYEIRGLKVNDKNKVVVIERRVG